MAGKQQELGADGSHRVHSQEAESRGCQGLPSFSILYSSGAQPKVCPTSYFKYPNLGNTWHGAQMSHQADNRE